MTYYTGLDVSLRFVSVCIIDDAGSVCHEAKVAAEVDQVTACLRAFSQDIAIVGFEAGALTQYLTYGLQAAGFEVVCTQFQWGSREVIA
jgi:transposase